jgi:hypothetical protein
VSTFPATTIRSSVRAAQLRCCALALALAVIAALLCTTAVSPAGAALIATGACNGASVSQPFARWGDDSSYELIAGGDFEGSLAGWSLSGGAQRVAGSDPYAATGTAGADSLALPAGASAQSPLTCVNAAYPTFRFFARTDELTSTVLVQVVYRTVLGTVAVPLGAVALSGEWQPTLPMLTGSLVTGALSEGTAEVALRFTAVTGGARIDDVFVDPWMR